MHLGEGQGLNGDLGSWISGKSSQGGAECGSIQARPGGLLLPGLIPLLLHGRQHSPPWIARVVRERWSRDG